MRKSETIVDSRFFVPSNIVDIKFKQDYDVGDGFGTEEPDTPIGIQAPLPGAPGNEPVVPTPLPTPNINFDIVSQTIKTAPDGTQTVDVVIELPDVTGAKYDVRYTRIV